MKNMTIKYNEIIVKYEYKYILHILNIDIQQ